LIWSILLFTPFVHIQPTRPTALEALDVRKANEPVSRDFNAFYTAFGHKLPNRLPGNAAKLGSLSLGYPL